MSIDKEVLFLMEYFNVLKSSNCDKKKSTDNFRMEIIKLLKSNSIQFKTVEIINNIYELNIENELGSENSKSKISKILSLSNKLSNKLNNSLKNLPEPSPDPCSSSSNHLVPYGRC